MRRRPTVRVAPVVAALLLLAALGGAAHAETIELLTRTGCPRCAAAKAFLAELGRERPGLVIDERRVDRDPAAAERLREVCARAGVEVPGVPTFVIGETIVVGFDSPGTTGRRIVSILDRDADAAEGGAGGAVCAEGEGAGACEPLDSGRVDTRFGLLDLRDLGLPVFTLLMGLIDGVNPCAMWVLLFLLGLLVNLKDRRRMALIAGTFVAASGLIYFAFMAAWLNVFLLIGLSRGVQIALGVVALVVGAFQLKDFVAFKRGPSLSIPDSARPGIYARARAVLRQRALAASLVAVIVLAVFVNIVELLCTAGLPAVYTAVLSEQGLSSGERYAYLALYNLAYIADDALMVTIAVVTLSKTRLTERGGRWLKLVSGVVMLALALALLVFPDALL